MRSSSKENDNWDQATVKQLIGWKETFVSDSLKYQPMINQDKMQTR